MQRREVNQGYCTEYQHNSRYNEHRTPAAIHIILRAPRLQHTPVHSCQHTAYRTVHRLYIRAPKALHVWHQSAAAVEGRYFPSCELGDSCTGARHASCAAHSVHQDYIAACSLHPACIILRLDTNSTSLHMQPLSADAVTGTSLLRAAPALTLACGIHASADAVTEAQRALSLLRAARALALCHGQL